MEIKIGITSTYSERDKSKELMNQINEILEDVFGGTIELDDTEEFVGGKEVPGAYLEYAKTEQGYKTDELYLIRLKTDDYKYFCDRTGEAITVMKPLFTAGKAIFSLFNSVKEGLAAIAHRVDKHFERPTKYGYLVVDDIGRGGDYGCIVGATYKDDGYDIKEITREGIAPVGRTVFDEVATHMLNREFLNIVWMPEGKSMANTVDAMKLDMDRRANKYDRYHTAIITIPDDDGQDKEFIAVAYTQKLTGECTATRAMTYNKAHPDGEEMCDYELEYVPLFDDDVKTDVCDGEGFDSKDKADAAYNETMRDAAGACRGRYHIVKAEKSKDKSEKDGELDW